MCREPRRAGCGRRVVISPQLVGTTATDANRIFRHVPSFLSRTYRRNTRRHVPRTGEGPGFFHEVRIGEAARRVGPPQPSRVGSDVQLCRVAHAAMRCARTEGRSLLCPIVGGGVRPAPPGQRVLARRAVWLVRGIAAPGRRSTFRRRCGRIHPFRCGARRESLPR